jgi:glycosyltransferase involved in cell wall biosynthesis
MKNVSIVIPAFNEGKNIGPVLRELKDCFPECEIVVVDDCSCDDTREKAEALSPHVFVRHRTNRGQGASLKTGILAASGEYVVLVDGDGQHPIEGIAELMRRIRERPELDAVLTERDNLYSSGFTRSIGKIVINLVTRRLTGEKVRDNNCGLRAFRRSAIVPFLFMLPDRFAFSTTSTVLAYKEGFLLEWVSISMRKRLNGESQVRIRHGAETLLLVLRLIVLFEPLQFFLPLSLYTWLTGGASITLSILVSGTIGKNYIFFFLFGSLAFILGFISEQIMLLRKEMLAGRK